MLPTSHRHTGRRAPLWFILSKPGKRLSPRGLGAGRGGQPAREPPPFVQVQASPREQGQALTHPATAASDLQPSTLTSVPRDPMPYGKRANRTATRKYLAISYALGALNTCSPPCSSLWQVGRRIFLLCTSPRSRSEAALTCSAFVPVMDPSLQWSTSVGRLGVISSCLFLLPVEHRRAQHGTCNLPQSEVLFKHSCVRTSGPSPK